MTIRSMHLDDVSRVCALDALCIPTPWSAETFETELSNPIAYYQVAEEDGEVVGYAGEHVVLDEAHVLTIGVHPDYRRRSIGERLLLDLLGHAIRAGAHRITLEVRAGNEGAQALYRKYSFQPISRRPRYYTDNGEDAIVMWVEDTNRPGFRTQLRERKATLEPGS